MTLSVSTLNNTYTVMKVYSSKLYFTHTCDTLYMCANLHTWSFCSLPHPFEERMRSLQFTHLRKLNRPKKKRALSDGTTQDRVSLSPRGDIRLTSDTKEGITLPPLVSKSKVQGPFRQPEDVWRQKHKPLSPTLRVATSYNSVEMARYKINDVHVITQ